MKQPRGVHRASGKLKAFDRHFFDSKEVFTVIGNGAIGGKAQGLYFIDSIIQQNCSQGLFGIAVNIPRMTVLASDVFDMFMRANSLYELAYSDVSDYVLARKFQQAQLPVPVIGDLQALINNVHQPLAIRSSSILEDAMYEPFAGIYGTKMIPNNQPDAKTRFHKLVEAIKFVYASTFFQEAKSYFKGISHNLEEEKMAVIIQEVVGLRHGDRFYPNISGVIRSYNHYPVAGGKPEDGVVSLALGLGKTIVDGGNTWYYSPPYPASPPPFNNVQDYLKQTQLAFWAINMGSPPAFDPMKETEYLTQEDLARAEYDHTLHDLASTYDHRSDRIYTGVSSVGPKILTFAPILKGEDIPLNRLITRMIPKCKQAVGHEIEIEFALTFDTRQQMAPRFGFLQIRPMVVSRDSIEISSQEFRSQDALVASTSILGNGSSTSIRDIVYLDPDRFDIKNSMAIAGRVAALNAQLLAGGTPYVLIGFGRWGTSDPWAGIPVKWGDICAAKVIVEATLPGVYVDLSQGSHFFHNVCSFKVFYFTVKDEPGHRIDWQWLQQQQPLAQADSVRHVRLEKPLTIKVSTTNSMGVVLK